MAYRKTFSGDNNANANNETASHNRIIMDTGAGFTIFAVFGVALVIGALVYIGIAYREVLQYGILITISGAFIGGWVILLNFVRRSVSKTTTVLAIDQTARSRAQLEANIAVASENYVLYRDENGILQFRGTVQVTENRHYPAQIEAPIDQKDIILTMYDKGSSARSIERHLKDKKVSYYEIQKTLNLYRPEWNKKVIESEQAYED